MKRTTRALITISMLLLVAGMFSGGCATSAMKGTPFYTGEYETRKGAPEDRVNMWPLVYYRNPALSVLWPFIEKTDEHFALRPIMSITGLDEEKRIYNLLWPLGQINQRTERHRFFPAFWSKDYFVVFPLYWHNSGPGTKTDALFPVWILRRNGEKYSYDFAWPLVNFKDWGRSGKGWRVWPVAGHYKKYDSDYSFFAWPLGHAWKDGTDVAGSSLFPLYFYGRDRDSRKFVSLPYSYGRSPDKDWDCGFPLFYRQKTGSGSMVVSPLYFAGHDTSADSDWQCLIPFYYKGRKKDEKVFATLVGGRRKSGDSSGWAVVPALSWGSTEGEDKGSFVAGAILGHRKWDGENGSSHVLPLYYRKKQDDKSLFVSLPYSAGRTKDSSWMLVPPLYYSSQDAAKKTLITPLYARSKALTDDAYWSALMPFYYRDGDKESSRCVTPVAAWKRKGDAGSWLVYPLLSGGNYQKDSGEMWLAGPLFHSRWDKDGVRRHVLPLYYRDTRNGTFISLPYSSWNTAGGRRARTVPALLSGVVLGEKRKDFWGAAGLVHASWGEGDTPHHVFPLYYRNAAAGSFVSPVYCSKADGDDIRRIIPPLLSSFTRSGEERRLTLLLGLSAHKWNGRHSSGYTFPLYAFDSKKNSFLSLPYASWKASDGRKARVVPPLLSGMVVGEKQKDLWGLGGLVHASWGEGDTPHHVLPLYYSDPGKGKFLSIPYCAKKKGDNITRVVPPLLSGFTRRGRERRLTVLLGLSRHEWDEDESAGYTFPLYAYGEDFMYTPLVGWNKDKRNGFVYPLTPLLGLRTGENKGGWLFPLFSYKKEPDNDVSGTYLWGQFWKRERDSGSWIFPLYSYKNHGSVEDIPSAPKAYRVAGKDFWSLPFCWYKNQVKAWPVYDQGRKTQSFTSMANKSNGVFPLWNYKSTKRLDSGEIRSSGALLFWLFDSKYENYPEREHEYSRKRVLWRLYHYEKLNGDVSVDAFPFITYDRKKDGDKSFSFMWRLFSYRKKQDGLKVHVLFIPFGKGK